MRQLAKKRVECSFEEDLVHDLDKTAALLHMKRTDIIKTACRVYLRSIRKGNQSLKAQNSRGHDQTSSSLPPSSGIFES